MKKIILKNIEIKYTVGLLLKPNSILISERIFPFSVLWKIDNNFRVLLPLFNEIIKKQDQYMENDSINPLLKKEYDELMNRENEIIIEEILYNEIKDCKLTGNEYQSIRFMLEGS